MGAAGPHPGSGTGISATRVEGHWLQGDRNIVHIHQYSSMSKKLVF